MADQQPSRLSRKAPSPLIIPPTQELAGSNRSPAPEQQPMRQSPSPRPQWIPDWSPSTGISPRAVRMHTMSPLATGDAQHFTFGAQPPRGSPIPPSHSGVFGRMPSPLPPSFSPTSSVRREETLPQSQQRLPHSAPPVPHSAPTVPAPVPISDPIRRHPVEPQEWPRSTTKTSRPQWAPTYEQTRGLSSQAKRREQFAALSPQNQDGGQHSQSTSHSNQTSKTVRFVPTVVGRMPVTYQLPVFKVPENVSDQGFPLIAVGHHSEHCEMGPPLLRCPTNPVNATLVNSTSSTNKPNTYSTCMGRKINPPAQAIVRPEVIGYKPITYYLPIIGYVREDTPIPQCFETDYRFGIMTTNQESRKPKKSQLTSALTENCEQGHVLHIPFGKTTVDNAPVTDKLVLPNISGHKPLTFDQNHLPGMKNVIIPRDEPAKTIDEKLIRKYSWKLNSGIDHFLMTVSSDTHQFVTTSQVDAAQRYWSHRLLWLPCNAQYDVLRVFYHVLSTRQEAHFVLRAQEFEYKYLIHVNQCDVHPVEVNLFVEVFHRDMESFL